jgi:hypothetical protein
MLATGHLRALELTLARSLALSKVPDAALETTASAELERGRPGLARIYLEAMQSKPQAAELRALLTEPRSRTD